ncbi:hypothetical protein SAMN04487867_14323 [Vreelandella titanicae]|uniref:Uncharacterized protein n=1 Tax=Vreelandella titanicae TaxID=664683 RepID=A0AAP9NLR6_9GAMM|nr:hypothetical protein FX987_01687 [Halomonas titanicae]SDJ42326.1 hypothetical protein SAMN04487867_14323 [Halomonas titanicae]
MARAARTTTQIPTPQHKNRKMIARRAIPKGYNAIGDGGVASLHTLIFSRFVYLLLYFK